MKKEGWNCCPVTMAAYILVLVGGLNWGAVAFDLNLVNTLVGSWPMVEKVVYAAVGFAAVFLVIKMASSCSKK